MQNKTDTLRRGKRQHTIFLLSVATLRGACELVIQQEHQDHEEKSAFTFLLGARGRQKWSRLIGLVCVLVIVKPWAVMLR